MTKLNKKSLKIFFLVSCCVQNLKSNNRINIFHLIETQIFSLQFTTPKRFLKNT